MTSAARCFAGEGAIAALKQAHSWSDRQVLGYHHPTFQNLLGSLLGDELRCISVTDEDGECCGVLPYRRFKTQAGILLNAFPFFGCNGLVVARDDKKEIITALIHAFRNQAREEDVLSATLYSPFNTPAADWVGQLEPDDVTVKFTQFLDLEETRGWPPKRLGDLRRAARRGYSIRRGAWSDADSIAAIYADNAASAGIPLKPRSFIDDTLAFETAFEWLVAEREGRVVAALLSGFGPLTASYVLPAAAAQERPFQPSAFLLDHAISRFRERGVRYWNFESSPAWDDPVFKYKERWGAAPLPFVVLTFYGARGRRPEAAALALARRDNPYYFVAPNRPVSGTWPRDVSLPPEWRVLSRFL
jgi:hypothetical protein